MSVSVLRRKRGLGVGGSARRRRRGCVGPTSLARAPDLVPSSSPRPFGTYLSGNAFSASNAVYNSGSTMSFFSKQFIDVIHWTEPADGVLAWRFPMEDMEIQNGGQLTVRDSQMAVFVNEGRIADVFAPGLYTLNTQTLPILTYLKNWDKAFKSPFKSDVYYFSTRQQTDQKWGTATPITIRDKEFGAIRVRGYGIYAYKIADPKLFYQKISGTRDIYHVPDLEGQLRNTIVARMTDSFAQSSVPFLDMAANQAALGQKIIDAVKPSFAELGLSLESFVVENISLPDELQKMLDQRISMNMLGDMGKYTQF